MEAYVTLKPSDVKNGPNLPYMAETQVEFPENVDRKEAELKSDRGFTLQGTPVQNTDEGEQKLIDGQRVGRKSMKTFRGNDTESEISVSGEGLKLEAEKYRVFDNDDYRGKKAAGSTPLDQNNLELITHHNEDNKEDSLRGEVREIHADDFVAVKNSEQNVDTYLNPAYFGGEQEDFKSEHSNTVQGIHPEQDDSIDYSFCGQKGETSPLNFTTNNAPIRITQGLDIGMQNAEETSDFRDKTKKAGKLFDCRDLDNEEHDEAYIEEFKFGITDVHKGPYDINTYFVNLSTGKTLCNFHVESVSASYICIRQKWRVVEKLNIIYFCNFFINKLICLRGKDAVTDRATPDQICSIIGINFVQLTWLIRSEHIHLWIINIQVFLEVTSVTEWKRFYMYAHQAFFHIVRSQREVSLQLHTMEALILFMWSPYFNMVTIVYGQSQITMTHINGQGFFSLVIRREASTVPNQSHGLMVLPSGENAEINPAKSCFSPTVAEQSSSSREVHVEHKGSAAECCKVPCIGMHHGSQPCPPSPVASAQNNPEAFSDVKEGKQIPPDIKGEVCVDQDELNNDLKSGHFAPDKADLHRSKSWKKDLYYRRCDPYSLKWKSILQEMSVPEFEDKCQLSGNSKMNRKIFEKFQMVFKGDDAAVSFISGICPENYIWNVFVVRLGPRHFITRNNNYQNENHRIATFPINIENDFRVRLAQAGFVYDAETETVVCPWCAVLVDIRDVAEDPVNLHSPTCDFRVRNHEVNIPVTGATSSPSLAVAHQGARQVNGPNVSPAALHSADRQPIGSGGSSITSQEPQSGMDGRVNDPTTSQAVCSDRDIEFTDVQVARGLLANAARVASGLNVLPALEQPATRQSIDRYESNITSEQLLRASDGSRNAPLPEAEFSHIDDIRCRNEEAPSGLQTDVGGYISGLNLPPVTAHAAGEQSFQLAASRSAQDEEPHADNGINNKPTSQVSLHKGGGDARSVELPAVGSPSETLKNASRRIGDTERLSGSEKNEMRVDETSIQQTASANANSVEETPPKYPEYAARNMRINSYQRWPAELRQRPEEMAECGFYYTGQRDVVYCFHCGIGLKQWKSEDDPWIEHARWSQLCFYVSKKKGQVFMQQAAEMAQRNAARTENGEENDSSEDNVAESADDQNKGTKDETKEATDKHEPNTNLEIMREHQELFDASLCKICLDSQLSMAFLPCGHIMTCANCSPFFKKCPACRALIKRKVTIYFD